MDWADLARLGLGLAWLGSAWSGPAWLGLRSCEYFILLEKRHGVGDCTVFMPMTLTVGIREMAFSTVSSIVKS